MIGVAKPLWRNLANAMDSKSIAERLVGSNPTGGTKIFVRPAGYMLIMYGNQIRSQAIDLHHAGWSTRSISRRIGVSRAAITEWLRDPERAKQRTIDSRCFVCADAPC